MILTLLLKFGSLLQVKSSILLGVSVRKHRKFTTPRILGFQQVLLQGLTHSPLVFTEGGRTPKQEPVFRRVTMEDSVI